MANARRDNLGQKAEAKRRHESDTSKGALQKLLEARDQHRRTTARSDWASDSQSPGDSQWSKRRSTGGRGHYRRRNRKPARGGRGSGRPRGGERPENQRPEGVGGSARAEWRISPAKERERESFCVGERWVLAVGGLEAAEREEKSEF